MIISMPNRIDSQKKTCLFHMYGVICIVCGDTASSDVFGCCSLLVPSSGTSKSLTYFCLYIAFGVWQAYLFSCHDTPTIHHEFQSVLAHLCRVLFIFRTFLAKQEKNKKKRDKEEKNWGRQRGKILEKQYFSKHDFDFFTPANDVCVFHGEYVI